MDLSASALKYLYPIIIILTSYNSLAQQMSYKKWNKEAKTNIRLLPKYGDSPKNPGQIAADNELIDQYVAQEGTRRKASEILVELGFDYLHQGDIKTAMYRFNQAWLLDPKNENVFWGFGSIYFTFNDFPKALEQYDEGLALNPRSSNIITDKATLSISKYYTDNNQNDLDEGIKLLVESYNIDDTNQNTLFKLSAAYFNNNDCENARKYYDECKKLGGKPLTKEFTNALDTQCQQRPADSKND